MTTRLMLACAFVSAAAACSKDGALPAGAGGAGQGASRGSSAEGTGGAGASIPVIPEAKSSAPRVRADAVSPSNLRAAVDANNAFAVDLYARVRSTAAASNLVVSPLSAWLSLTMAYAGADGHTAAAMATALHFRSDGAAELAGQNALVQDLDLRAAIALALDTSAASSAGMAPPSPSQYQLQIVNSLWGQAPPHSPSAPVCTWSPFFLDALAKDYGAGMFLEDFTHPDAARVAINGWVSAETSGAIGDLLPSPSDADGPLVLVNAIHVRLHWDGEFESVGPRPFTRADGSVVDAQTMSRTTVSPYVDDGDAQIVELPLVGDQLSVVIAMPHGDLAAYEATLTPQSTPFAGSNPLATVELSIPKLSLAPPSFSLKQPLSAMGMSIAFGRSGTFGRMVTDASDCPLGLGDVWQQTTIDMEEKGVEATAATAVVVSPNAESSSAGEPPSPVVVKIDRPYVFAIVDQPTGAILFVGHVGDPTAAAP